MAISAQNDVTWIRVLIMQIAAWNLALNDRVWYEWTSTRTIEHIASTDEWNITKYESMEGRMNNVHERTKEEMTEWMAGSVDGWTKGGTDILTGEHHSFGYSF